MIRDLIKIVASDPDLQRVQDNLEQFLKPLKQIDILNGLILENISVSTSPIRVEHKLGRKIKGWILVRKSANVSVWDSQATNDLETKLLILTSSGSATISIWVF